MEALRGTDPGCIDWASDPVVRRQLIVDAAVLAAAGRMSKVKGRLAVAALDRARGTLAFDMAAVSIAAEVLKLERMVKV